MQYSTMDQASTCSSDLSDGLSNDTFEITRRGRQDVRMEGRLESRRFASSRFVADPSDSFPLPTIPSSTPISSLCSTSINPTTLGFSVGKRRVNFVGKQVINEGYQQEIISEEEMRVRWWSQEDLDEIKQSAKEMSLRLRRQAKERGCFVETAHKKTSLMLTSNFQELVKLSASSPDQDLRHWCARSDGRRGLERFASREYGGMRKEDVMNARKAVFQEQKRQRANNVFAPEALAKVSKERTRRARTFSLFMGEADAQAAARGVSRRSSKRCKVAHSNSRPTKTQSPTRHVSSGVRNFTVDTPLLKSAA